MQMKGSRSSKSANSQFWETSPPNPPKPRKFGTLSQKASETLNSEIILFWMVQIYHLSAWIYFFCALIIDVVLKKKPTICLGHLKYTFTFPCINWGLLVPVAQTGSWYEGKLRNHWEVGSFWKTANHENRLPESNCQSHLNWNAVILRRSLMYSEYQCVNHCSSMTLAVNVLTRSVL